MMRFVVPAYLLAVIWGVRCTYASQTSLDFFLPLTLRVVLAWWAINDSVDRKHPINLLSRDWFLVGIGFFLPAYLIWSRGWRGVGLTLLNVILWTVVVGITMEFASWVLFRRI